LTDRPENFGQDFSADDGCAMVRAHWAGIYRLMYRLCGHAHDAEELTQETFLRALEKRHQYQPNTNLRGWLMRIGTNLFLDAKRRKQRPVQDIAPLHLPDTRSPGEGTPEQQELGRQLETALSHLSDVRRAVVVLRGTQDMAFSEIAEVIGTTEATARWHMMQARQELGRLLDGKV